MHDDRVAAEVERGMRRQLDGLGELAGWKMGLTVPAVQQQLGLDGPVMGHLPRSAVVAGEHSMAGAANVAVEPELALEIGPDGELGRMGLAFEVVDLDRGLDELEQVLAENVFQRAVALGPLCDPVSEPEVVLSVDGEERARLGQLEPPQHTLRYAREFLGRFGVAPEPGQVVIAGSLLMPPLPGEPGTVELRADGLGELALRLVP